MTNSENNVEKGHEGQEPKGSENAAASGVIGGSKNQEIFGQATESSHSNDRTLSEPDLIAMEEGESLSEYKARVEKIQANRFGFYDSADEKGSTETTGKVIDYKPKQVGSNSFALGMDYEENQETRSSYEKLAALMSTAGSRATDPEGWKAWMQGEIDVVVDGLDDQELIMSRDPLTAHDMK